MKNSGVGPSRSFTLRQGTKENSGSANSLLAASGVSPSPIKNGFQKVAEVTSTAVGSYWAFLIAGVVVLLWAVTGPYFDYSDTWQLVINTGTTIVTFLMVFVIQNAQNRASRVVELKLDELLRGTEGARTSFIDLDHMTEDELECVKGEFLKLREKFAPLVDDDIDHIDRELSQRRKAH
jgi:low affinity Fe/Cu permease